MMAGPISVCNSPVHRFNYSLCSQVPHITFNHSKEGSLKLRFNLSRSSSYKPLTIVASTYQPPSTMSATHFDNTLPSKEVLEMWRKADAVCFDVDSTVCLDEGIDELADFCGAGKAVAEWTNKAMSGSVLFEEALAARLSLFNPSLSQVHDFLDKRPPKISPGIAELINKLKATSTDVYMISGGFRQMINPVASQLGIPLEKIFANQLLFGSSGEFLGFDKTEFTSRSGGKATAVEHIRKVHGYKTLVMIGDGATDLEIDFDAKIKRQFDVTMCLSETREKEEYEFPYPLERNNSFHLVLSHRQPDYEESASGGHIVAECTPATVRSYKEWMLIKLAVRMLFVSDTSDSTHSKNTEGRIQINARRPGGADLFVCYGGVQLRATVAASADWLVYNFQELMSSLE